MTTPQTRRHGGTPRDIMLSLAVLLVPIALVVGLTRACTDIAVVDPAGAFAQARTANLFPVVEPHGLGPQWRSVRATYDSADGTGTLRVGYLTPDDGNVQLLETNEDPQALLPREFGNDVQPTGQVDLAGSAWRSYRVRGQEQALVLTVGERTTLVQGQASATELQILAGSLA